jgi:hypothetical protein
MFGSMKGSPGTSEYEYEFKFVGIIVSCPHITMLTFRDP